MTSRKWTGLSRAGESADAGEFCYSLVERLYPLCRSITGAGTRETLEILGEYIDIQISEIATGTSVFDWTVPKEWNIRGAFIETLAGEKIIDFKDSNLHVVSYSTPIDDIVSLDELQQHLHSIPEHPDWIPYRTAYYNETWGFCLSENQRRSLCEDRYRVCIDSDLAPGYLNYGEYFLKGDSDEEFLIFTHVCHPSLCNDNLSGISIAVRIAQTLRELPSLNRSYRFVFAPATIGSITWLSQNQHKLGNIEAGLVLAVAGDPGTLTYKRNRNPDSYIDRIVEQVLSSRGAPYDIVEFSPWGYDERQFCSPGIDLPIGSLTRTPNGCYPEYHTSADNLDLVRPEFLADSLSAYLEVLDVFDNNGNFVNLQPHGEPQLGKRGLYRKTGGQQSIENSILAKLWVLNQSDGQHSLLDIANRANMPFEDIRAAAEALLDADLLREQS